MTGSSPLTRGKRRSLIRSVVEVRLIPAHAGKTSSGSTTLSPVWAHPRSRGENYDPISDGIFWEGSSPLTRGKHWWLTLPRSLARLIPAHAGKTQWLDSQKWSVGLIPAHAGKTPTRSGQSVQSAAHPRSRGENVERGHEVANGQGSSPLTRGKPVPSLRTPPADGLIPAHAGKTSPAKTPERSTGAHPRSRGENVMSWAIHVIAGGSSPLTRGKRERA